MWMFEMSAFKTLPSVLTLKTVLQIILCDQVLLDEHVAASNSIPLWCGVSTSSIPSTIVWETFQKTCERTRWEWRGLGEQNLFAQCSLFSLQSLLLFDSGSTFPRGDIDLLEAKQAPLCSCTWENPHTHTHTHPRTAEESSDVSLTLGPVDDWSSANKKRDPQSDTHVFATCVITENAHIWSGPVRLCSAPWCMARVSLRSCRREGQSAATVTDGWLPIIFIIWLASGIEWRRFALPLARMGPQFLTAKYIWAAISWRMQLC